MSSMMPPDITSLSSSTIDYRFTQYKRFAHRWIFLLIVLFLAFIVKTAFYATNHAIPSEWTNPLISRVFAITMVVMLVTPYFRYGFLGGMMKYYKGFFIYNHQRGNFFSEVIYDVFNSKIKHRSVSSYVDVSYGKKPLLIVIPAVLGALYCLLTMDYEILFAIIFSSGGPR